MVIAKLILNKCIQDSQEYGSNDEFMVSRVFFDLKIGDKLFQNLYVDIKQIVGSNYESYPLEIGPPNNYSGPLNYSEFRDAIEKYYRGLVGKQGSGIHIAGAGNIRMQNNTFIKQQVYEFNIEDDKGGW